MFSVRKALKKKSASSRTSEVAPFIVVKVLKNKTSEAGLEVCYSRKL